MIPNRSRNLLRNAAALLAALTLASALPGVPEKHWRKVILRGEDPARVEALADLGARSVVDKPGLRLFEIPQARLNAAEEIPGVSVRLDWDLVRLENETFDTQRRAGELPTRPLQIVQFRYPPREPERALVKETGARILGYLRENAFLIWSGDPQASHSLAGNEGVQYLGGYTARHALDRKLAEREGEQPLSVTVQLFDDGKQAFQDLEWLLLNEDAANISLPFRQARNVVSVSLEAPIEVLRKLAERSAVLNIEPGAIPRLYGENGSMISANQTFLFDHDGDPATPRIERARFDASLGAAHDNIYLKFLRDHLLYEPGNPAYQNPETYPILAVMDDGISDGGRTDRIEQPGRFPVIPGAPDPPDAIPDYPDFHFLGDLDEPSRVVFNFWYRWQQANGFGDGAWEFGNPATYPEVGEDFLTGPVQIGTDDQGNPIREGDEIGQFGHGHTTSSLIGGYNGEPGPANRHQPTQLGYGIGVSPYGRLGNAKFWSLDSGFWMLDGQGRYEPQDFYWIVDKVWDTIGVIDGSTNRPVVFNCSFGNEQFEGCLDPDYNPLDPDINPTSPNFNPVDDSISPTAGIYDRFAQFFDLMTRSATHPQIHPDKEERPTLFIFGAGQVGFEHYGNGWRDVLGGTSTPTDSIWNTHPGCPGPGEDYKWGFQIPRNNTIATPALAKNVIAVGASEAYDMRPIELCDPEAPASPAQQAEFYGLADNPDDIVSYSPKGLHLLAGEARVKPDIVAPSQGDYTNFPAARFPGLQKCFAGNYNNIPGDATGTRVYIRAGGTSAAAPMVSGAAQLSLVHLDEVYGLNNPSPALLKAYLLQTGKFLGGGHTGRLDPDFPGPPAGYEGPDPPEEPTYLTHPLPSPYQGWGRINTAWALEQTPRFFLDQAEVLEEGQEYTARGLVADSEKPFRVTVTWTDPPNLSVNKDTYYDLVNNLDLVVKLTRPGETTRAYLGNRFSPDTLQYSEEFDEDPVNWPQPDRVNNVECVFLPPQPAGTRVEITVRGDGLNMDALNPYEQLTEQRRQDFALVAYNYVEARQNPDVPSAAEIQDSAPPVIAGWASSPELLAMEDGGDWWFRLSDPLADGEIAEVLLESSAPEFDPEEALEWDNPSAVSVRQDGERGAVLAFSEQTLSGASATSEERGLNIPAWDLPGKTLLRVYTKAESPAAELVVHLEATDGTRHESAFSVLAGPDQAGEWRSVTKDLRGAAGANRRVSHVVGIEAKPGDGELLLDDLRLIHPADLELYAGESPESLGLVAVQNVPVQTPDVWRETYEADSANRELFIRVRGNASRGNFTLSVNRRQGGQISGDSWGLSTTGGAP